MDRLNSMQAFVAVAELRSFTGAARRLRLSPSVVTRLVSALEGDLEARLLQRTTRAVTLTDAGAHYLDRVRRILGDLAEAESAVRKASATPTGRFVVAAPSTFGRLHVAPLMCRFLDAYPKVRGELFLDDRRTNLVDEGIDLAVRIGTLDDASFVARSVGATRRVVVASPKYLARRRPKIREPKDLAEHDLVQFTSMHPHPEWHFVRQGARETELRHRFVPSFATNSADAAIARVQSGGGLAMLFSYQAAEALRAGKLEVVLERFEPPPLPIHLVYPTARQVSAKVKAFASLVKATCDWRFVDL